MPQLATFGAKVPVTVVTGFLGSGKSTLVNYLLSQRGDKNIAVIENEFGEVNIDKTLVGDQLAQKEDLVSLENGCVCCSLRKDIVKAFAELQKRSQNRSKPMDHILLETTGLADPSPVAFTFFANPWIAARFKLDSITCLVDAKYLLQHLEDANHGGPNKVGKTPINEAVQQLAFSDLILLNKVDLVTSAQKQVVMDAIRRINTTARIIECQLNCEDKRPPLTEILGTNTFSVQRALTVDPQFLDSDTDTDSEEPIRRPSSMERLASAQLAPAASTQAPLEASDADNSAAAAADGQQAAADVQGEQQADAGAEAEQETANNTAPAGRLSGDKRRAGKCEHAHQSDSKKPKRRRKIMHDLSDVSSVGITTRGQLDEYRFNMFMRDLLTEKAKDIFRCKGVLCVHGYGSKKFVFQGVHETICYGPAEKPWAEDEPRLNQIVFIGRGLDRKMLIEGFRTCVWQPLPDGWQEATDETTKRPYYWNKHTGEKCWQRPNANGPHGPVLTAHQTTTSQPPGIAPSRMRTAGSGVSGSGVMDGNMSGTGANNAQNGSDGGSANKAVAVA